MKELCLEEFVLGIDLFRSHGSCTRSGQSLKLKEVSNRFGGFDLIVFRWQARGNKKRR